MGRWSAAGADREPGIYHLAVQVRVLGPVDVVGDDDNPVAIGAAKQRALLALLALSLNEVVSSDRIIDALWPDEPPLTARNLVQGYVSKLRRVVGPERIESTASGYRLCLTPAELDAARFEQLVADGDAATALALWRGPVLGDLGDEVWAAPVVGRLDDLRATARADRADQLIREGRGSDAVVELETLVREHPLDEHVHALLMRALYACGRQADSLRAYAAARSRLVDELGVEPGPELRELEAAILRQDAGLVTHRREFVERAVRPVVALPATLTPLVGRDKALASLVDRLANGRLVTIAGPGGVGKTRLALEHCRAASSGEEAAFVDLAPIDGPSVARTVAAVYGLAEDPTHSWVGAIADYIGNSPALIVLDNAEHVLEAVTALVARLLASCARAQVLVTSREPLGVTGERVMRLDGLAPADAERLLWERATVTPCEPSPEDNAGAAIVAKLDGLPLAIELAAARLETLTPAQLAERLDDHLSVLADPGRGRVDRHRTIEAAIGWSYELLGGPERIALDRLSVLAGAFLLEAAESVAGPNAIDAVSALVHRSMLVRAPDVNGAAAFRMLEPIKQFAATRLHPTDRAAAERALDTHLRDAATRIARDVRTSRSPAAMELARFESEDFRRAVARLASSPTERADLVADLYWPWFLDGHLVELRDWTSAALSAGSMLSHRVQARLWWARSATLIALGDLSGSEEAARRQQEAAERAWDNELAGLAHSLQGMVAWAGGEHDRARPQHRLAVELVAAGGDEWTTALVSALAGRSMMVTDADAGSELLLAAEAAARHTGEPMVLGSSLDYQAGAALERGELVDARKLAQRSLDAYRTVGYREGVASALGLLGIIAVLDNDVDRSTAVFAESLELCRRLQHRGGIASSLEGLALVASGRGDPTESRRLLAEADAIRADAGIPVPPHLAAATHDLRTRIAATGS